MMMANYARLNVERSRQLKERQLTAEATDEARLGQLFLETGKRFLINCCTLARAKMQPLAVTGLTDYMDTRLRELSHTTTTQ